MSNHLARRNPYTDLWMNLSVCAPCRRLLEKDGKHRKHDCKSFYFAGSACVFCDCECHALTTGFIELMEKQSMALDLLRGDVVNTSTSRIEQGFR